MISSKRIPIAISVVAMMAMPVFPAMGQSWPTKPVSVVVGSPAGSAPDIYARILAEQLAAQTGGTFIVENKAGANGNISAEAVLRAPADGHTLWLGTQSMVTINPAAYPKLRWKLSDFKPIVKGVEAPMVLVTHPSTSARNFEELRNWLSAQKGKVAYASFSPGTPSHFLGHQLGERLKADMVHVPYKGSAPQVNDLLGGHASLGFTQVSVAVPHIKAGKLNAVAVTGPKRAASLPQVPTLAEVGLKDLTATIWFGLLAPADTPKPVLDAILANAKKAHAEAGLRAKLEAQNFEMADEAGAEFEQAIAAESARWAGVVKATGFSANE